MEKEAVGSSPSVDRCVKPRATAVFGVASTTNVCFGFGGDDDDDELVAVVAEDSFAGSVESDWDVCCSEDDEDACCEKST